jgi:serine/threonine-protein kinase
MEYLDGVTLERLVRLDGPQPPARVVHLLRQACGALAEAHGVGLVHGDIKPANIILLDRGGIPDLVKVVDFGLVRHIDPRATDATQTMPAGTVVRGTPLYLSPEAVTGVSSLDGRSDLYALGAVGYFLLTGQPLFEAASIVEIFVHHLQTAPVPPSVRAGRDVPCEVEQIVLRCLAKNADDRPADAATLARQLDACAARLPWPREEAAAWWGRYRSRHAAAARGEEPSGAWPAPTVAVDLSARV